jgi:type IV pilus assembly protein PilV
MKQYFQAGTSMVEILVAMILIASGALAIAGMQMSAAKYNKEAALRSVASLLSSELSDRMRSNIAGVKAGNYNRNLGYVAALSSITAPSCGTTSDCTSAQLAQLDISSWQKSLTAALPGGAGAIIPNATTKYAYTIVVMWQDKSLSDAGVTDPACTVTPQVGVRCFTTMFMP